MIEGIKEIGELVKEKEFLKSLVKETDNIDYIVIVNFDTQNNCVEFIKEEANKEKLKKYLWIGNASGNSKQIYFTTDSLNNILFKTIDDTKKYIEDDLNNSDKFSSLKKMLNKKLFEPFFKQFLYKNKKGEENEVYYLDWNKIKDFTSKFYEFNDYQKSDKTKIKPEEFIILKDNKPDTKKYNSSIKKLYGFDEKNEYKKEKRYLYVITIDGKMIFEISEQYKKLLEYENLEKLFSKNGKDKKYLKLSTCSICGKQNILCTSKEYAFKFYIQDKPGFSSDMDKKFTKNFSICEDCYRKSFSGKSFVKNHLKSHIGDNNFYIIPHFFLKPLDIDLKKISEEIKDIYNPAANFESINDFNMRLTEHIRFSEIKNYMILNYLFYKQNKAEFSLKKVIKDVKPLRFKIIFNAFNKINNNDELKKYFKSKITLKKIYYLIPIQKDKSSQYYLNILEAILKENKVNIKKLIEKFVEGTKLIYYWRITDDKKQSVYNLGKIYKDKEFKISVLRDYILSCNFMLMFLHKINCFKRRNKMGNKNIDEVFKILKEKVEFLENLVKQEDNEKKKESLKFVKNKYEKLITYFENMKEIINSEEKIGLTLLGYLISEVAYRQKKAGHENIPVLNKINYSGMKIKQIIKFSNIIAEKLQQYKIIGFNELLLFLKDKLLIPNIDKWELSKDENVFYILSGYSVGASDLKTKEDIKEEIVSIEEDKESSNK